MGDKGGIIFCIKNTNKLSFLHAQDLTLGQWPAEFGDGLKIHETSTAILEFLAAYLKDLVAFYEFFLAQGHAPGAFGCLTICVFVAIEVQSLVCSWLVC